MMNCIKPNTCCILLGFLFPLFMCFCLFRSGVAAGCWSACGSPVAAAAGSDGVLPEEEEEESESVRGAAPHVACSAIMLCSGDPGLSGLLGHVSTTKNMLIVQHSAFLSLFLSFKARHVD